MCPISLTVPADLHLIAPRWKFIHNKHLLNHNKTLNTIHVLIETDYVIKCQSFTHNLPT